MKKFGLGEVVKWVSLRGDEREGVVVKVVRAGDRPRGYRNVARDAQIGRDHESYVVEGRVNGKKRYCANIMVAHGAVITAKVIA